MSTTSGAPGTAADGYRTPQVVIPVPREQSDPREPGRRIVAKDGAK